MATRTRHEYLKDLALNHSTSTTLDTSTKFCKLFRFDSHLCLCNSFHIVVITFVYFHFATQTSHNKIIFSRVAALMGFSRGGKKDKRGIKYIPDAVVRGALSWPLTLHDAALQQNVSIFPTTIMCKKAIGDVFVLAT